MVFERSTGRKNDSKSSTNTASDVVLGFSTYIGLSGNGLAKKVIPSIALRCRERPLRWAALTATTSCEHE